MPRILILTTSHGASHRRAAEALQKAFIASQTESTAVVIDAIAYCARWFRAYYDSYLIPLRYWPGLWRWIESRQHQSSSTSPAWIYRWGGRPLFRYMREFAPDVVIATEVGLAELAALFKRTSNLNFYLAGVELMDFNRAWVQTEIDLYAVTHRDLGEELIAAGAPRSRVLDCGMPIDLVYSNPPERSEARVRLGLAQDVPVLLVLFGGTGFGNARAIVASLRQVEGALQIVFITGRNRRLESELRKLTTAARFDRAGGLSMRVFGWVSNMHEWMAAADLLLSKPGGGTLMEAAACGLPLLAFDPLPGNEERTCHWLEKWRIGLWLKNAGEIAPAINSLLANPAELSSLRKRARLLSRPRAAYTATEAILQGWSSRRV